MTVNISDCRLCKSTEYQTIDIEHHQGVEYTIAQCASCSLVYTKETTDDISPDYQAMTDEDIDEEMIW